MKTLIAYFTVFFRAVLATMPMFGIVSSLIAFNGIVMYAVYHDCDPLLSGRIDTRDQVPTCFFCFYTHEDIIKQNRIGWWLVAESCDVNISDGAFAGLRFAQFSSWNTWAVSSNHFLCIFKVRFLMRLFDEKSIVVCGICWSYLLGYSEA